jgi:hypothetical protein
LNASATTYYRIVIRAIVNTGSGCCNSVIVTDEDIISRAPVDGVRALLANNFLLLLGAKQVEASSSVPVIVFLGPTGLAMVSSPHYDCTLHRKRAVT